MIAQSDSNRIRNRETDLSVSVSLSLCLSLSLFIYPSTSTYLSIFTRIHKETNNQKYKERELSHLVFLNTKTEYVCTKYVFNDTVNLKNQTKPSKLIN